MKRFLFLIVVMLIVGVLVACGGETNASKDNSNDGNSGNSGNSEKSEEIIIGSKFFTEQYILSKITTLYLKENGINIKEIENLGSTAVREALLNDQVDLYWEYTGTALVTYLGEDAISDGEESYNVIKELDEENGITWENMTDINTTFVLVMKEEDAEDLGVKTISDLASVVNENPSDFHMGVDAEFGNREDGIKGVQETYGFEFETKNIKTMEQGLQYSAIDNGDVNVTFGYSTDPQINQFDLVIIEDDLNYFPAYYAAINIRDEIAKSHPELIELTSVIAEELDSDTMLDLNYKVDIEEQSVDEVANAWLQEQGLID